MAAPVISNQIYLDQPWTLVKQKDKKTVSKRVFTE
jgi:hypothetical protein